MGGDKTGLSARLSDVGGVTTARGAIASPDRANHRHAAATSSGGVNSRKSIGGLNERQRGALLRVEEHSDRRPAPWPGDSCSSGGPG